MGTVDLDEVSLDMARYAEPDTQESFVGFLGNRPTKWQPDLVVLISVPAARTVAKYLDRLFPHTPILYAGMDQRTLPPDALQTNAAHAG